MQYLEKEEIKEIQLGILDYVDKICKKVGEEASETIIAAKNNDKEELIGEIGDLFYHVFVLMNNQGVSLEDIENKLKERHKITGNKKEFHTRGEY